MESVEIGHINGSKGRGGISVKDKLRKNENREKHKNVLIVG